MTSKNDPKHFAAFQRGANIAKRLTQKLIPILGPHYAAGAVIEGALDVLLADLGAAGAALHLRELAADIESYRPPRLQ